MYHADYWHDNFPAPMVSVDKDRNIFVNDFITYNNAASLGERTVGKVLKIFLSEGIIVVCNLYTCMYICTF